MAHSLDYKAPPVYSSYKKRAQERFPDEIILSEDQFKALSMLDCHYCGKSGPNGIDRINNMFGYRLDNCVPACKHCNYVKGDLSQVDFDTWKNRFIDHQIKRKDKV